MLYFFHVAGASALWALAGVTRYQQQRIASMIGINILVDMLMLKSETLQFIAGRAIIALTTENIENQNKIVAGGGVQPLVRLLRSAKTSEKVCKFIDLNLLGKKKFSVMSCLLIIFHNSLHRGWEGGECWTVFSEDTFPEMSCFVPSACLLPTAYMHMAHVVTVQFLCLSFVLNNL